ncbi:D-mannose binding lectin [Frondihabitans australicus]|uniref:D-mannose binding lectin n=2 Tax=Frondihabitans australicus TaxID=386892 RepID=A0A495IDE9_9MICO|nr:D-mannose binding lectin [Frondihabitans australicus]
MKKTIRRAAATVAVAAVVAGAAFGLAPANASSPVNRTPNTLPTNLSLQSGQYRMSTGGQYILRMQTDGNLVEVGNGRAIWSSKTGGHPGAYFKMQTDGNAVVYTSNGKPLWSTQTAKAGVEVEGEVAVGKDGYWVVRRNTGQVVWRSPGAGTSSMGGGYAELETGWYLYNGPAQLIMQSDGNLVSYVNGKAVWSSGTSGHAGAAAFVDPNGDFDVEALDGTGPIVWFHHGVAGTSGAALSLSTTGVVTLAQGSKVLWRS